MRRRLTSSLLLATSAVWVCSCGSGGGATRSASSTPAYLNAPVTHQQRLVQEGARLVVADGCAACHLGASSPVASPSFTSFAGRRVTLADGRRALVDERFVRQGLLDPATEEIKGYPAEPMLAALARLHLRSRPGEVAALAAFIEQVGPETE